MIMIACKMITQHQKVLGFQDFESKSVNGLSCLVAGIGVLRKLCLQESSGQLCSSFI